MPATVPRRAHARIPVGTLARYLQCTDLRMRILGVGGSCDLGDMYLRLAKAGHAVRVFCADDPPGERVMEGMLEHVESWQDQLGWIRQADSDGVIVFETVHDGAVQDQLRRDGFFVIGGSELGDRLENDRAFGQRVLSELGMRTAETWTFTDFDQAAAFIRSRPARYVFKLNGGVTSAWRNYVGQRDDGGDVIALLAGQRARLAGIGGPDLSFVLMEHVSGVETGVGAYFDGERFLPPACLDWEHKRFFPGNLGELTGEMGTLVTYEGSERIFSATLLRLAPLLRESGYVGYINLNTIIDERGIWPLELTCRFGYPGFAILDALQPQGWAALFRALRDRRPTRLPTAPGFAVGVVLTVPPFPYRQGYAEISRGIPISFDPAMRPEQLDRLHFAEVALASGQLVTSGSVGYVMVATGVGPTVHAAQDEAYAVARGVMLPNVRYRNDIGDGFLAGDGARLRQLGYLGQRTPSSRR
jgi:phosphoribosylamine--glycine ligase